MSPIPSPISIVADRLYTPEETAAIYGIHPQTLAIWRRGGRGPASIKLGYRTVRYRGSAILHHLDAGERELPADGE